MLDQGYGIMPNSVLFDKDLSDKQKLLFCLISSLCAEKGYCRATNEYLGEKLGCSEDTITKNGSQLRKSGYVDISIEGGNRRKIILGESFLAVGKNTDRGRQKSLPSGRQKHRHNNTIDNIIKEYLPEASENLIQAIKDHNDTRSNKDKIENLKERGQKIVFSHIMKQGENEKDIIDAIEFSIGQGYKGVFVPKKSKEDQSKPNKLRSDDQRVARIREQKTNNKLARPQMTEILGEEEQKRLYKLRESRHKFNPNIKVDI